MEFDLFRFPQELLLFEVIYHCKAAVVFNGAKARIDDGQPLLAIKNIVGRLKIVGSGKIKLADITFSSKFVACLPQKKTTNGIVISDTVQQIGTADGSNSVFRRNDYDRVSGAMS